MCLKTVSHGNAQYDYVRLKAELKEKEEKEADLLLRIAMLEQKLSEAPKST